MDRHMRRRVYIFLIMAVVGYVSVFEVMYPDKGGILKKVYQDKIAGTSQTDTGIRIETVANTTSEPGEKQVYYTLAPNNLTRDKVYELMLGKEGSEFFKDINGDWSVQPGCMVQIMVTQEGIHQVDIRS